MGNAIQRMSHHEKIERAEDDGGFATYLTHPITTPQNLPDTQHTRNSYPAPPLRIPSEIISATERGMISGPLCTLPSPSPQHPSSRSSSSDEDSQLDRDVGIGAAVTTNGEKELLTRAEEADTRRGHKKKWDGVGRGGVRHVRVKGVDV